MSNKKDVYVVRHGDKWGVRSEGSKKLTKITDTQKEAIDRARPIAQNRQAELRIQGRDGKFRDSDSYGPDPNPPKDRKH